MQDAEATVRYGFDSTKIDSCGPEGNISAWREALDAASLKYGDGRHIAMENCRNYAYTQSVTTTTECQFDTFRSTEDNAPDFASIMHNLMTNAQAPGSSGNVHGGLPVSHPGTSACYICLCLVSVSWWLDKPQTLLPSINIASNSIRPWHAIPDSNTGLAHVRTVVLIALAGCWSYPDMLETVGSGRCRQDLPNGTCGHPSPGRRSGGLDLNESRAHFGAWCVVSSPLVLGHDLSNDDEYDAAWPVVGNAEAIRVNQAYAGDAGRLVAVATNQLDNLELYHGAGCECVYPGTLPQWSVFAKRLDQHATEAGVIAINFSNETIAAATIKVSVTRIFGDSECPTPLSMAERDLWTGAVRAWPTQHEGNATGVWIVPELAPRSSYFVSLQRRSSP